MTMEYIGATWCTQACHATLFTLSHLLSAGLKHG